MGPVLNALRRRFRTSIYPRLPAGVKERYAAYRFGPRHRQPNEAFLETTSACNLNCVMCAAQRPAIKRVKPSGYMDVSLFRRLIDEIVCDLSSIKTVFLHKDGEPLLHPDIVEMIDYAARRHPDVRLVTNATLLDEAMARAILATPLQHIRFSVDGLTPATFEKIRIQLPANEFAGTGTAVGFDAVMANIERFLALKTALGNTTLTTRVRTTDFTPTSGELDGYRAHWVRKVDFVDVAPLLSWTGEVGKQRTPERDPCMAPWATVVVSWDGALVPCCTYLDTTGHRKGALFDLTHGTLRAALQAESRKALMRAHLDETLDEQAAYCVPCRDWRRVPVPVRGRSRILAQLRDVAR